MPTSLRLGFIQLFGQPPMEICKTDMTKKIFGIKLNSDKGEYFYRLSDKYEI